MADISLRSWNWDWTSRMEFCINLWAYYQSQPTVETATSLIHILESSCHHWFNKFLSSIFSCIPRVLILKEDDFMHSLFIKCLIFNSPFPWNMSDITDLINLMLKIFTDLEILEYNLSCFRIIILIIRLYFWILNNAKYAKVSLYVQSIYTVSYLSWPTKTFRSLALNEKLFETKVV